MKTLVASIAWLVLCSASMALQTPYPSNPLTIVGLQGRPIPNATVGVTNLAGIPVTIFNDTEGSAFPGIVPSSGVLQFFMAIPGVYIVTVQGEGLTRRYYTTVGIGVGSGVGKISIDRSAEELNRTTLDPAVLVCDTDGHPCWLEFSGGLTQQVSFDFILPSYSTTFLTLMYSWVSPSIAGSMVWGFDFCVYKVNQSPCVPNNVDHLTFKSSTASSTGVRVDAIFNLGDVDPEWEPNDHVVVFVKRMGSNIHDQLSGIARLENVRLELQK